MHTGTSVKAIRYIPEVGTTLAPATVIGTSTHANGTRQATVKFADGHRDTLPLTDTYIIRNQQQ